MKPEEMVCSLEQAKKMHKLGVRIDTYFEYVQYESDVIDGEREEYFPPDLITSETRKACEAHILFYYSAPTVAELGNLLPRLIENKNTPGVFNVCAGLWCRKTGKDEYLVGYFDGESDKRWFASCNKNEAQARADALIWLIENGYLKVEEIEL